MGLFTMDWIIVFHNSVLYELSDHVSYVLLPVVSLDHVSSVSYELVRTYPDNNLGVPCAPLRHCIS